VGDGKRKKREWCGEKQGGGGVMPRGFWGEELQGFKAIRSGKGREKKQRNGRWNEWAISFRKREGRSWFEEKG